MSLAAKPYDLVLMDTAMRDLDGVETTSASAACTRRRRRCRSWPSSPTA